MHLYSKPISAVAWADVVRFCEENISENTYLDYKSDFPKDLAKTIAAMANTLGGLVLIGVQETDTGHPVLPIEGVQLARGLEEQVLNTIVDSMSPPLIPEIATCVDATGKKAVVVVRVPQSEHAPHALHSNSTVYVRTGKRNKPEDIADLERVDWLRGKRKKAEDLREWIFTRARQRFLDMRDGHVLDIPRTEEGIWTPVAQQPALLTIALCPLYPDKTLATPADLETIRRSIVVRDYIGTGHEFPLQEAGCVSRMVEDGFVMHFSGKGKLRTYHTHLNMHGLFFYQQSLLYQMPATEEGREDGHKAAGRKVVRGYEILARLYEVVESGSKFYEKLGYWGSLKFRLRVEGLLGIPFLMPELEGDRLVNYDRASTDPEIDTSHTLQSADLKGRMHHSVLPLFERVGWALNSHVSIGALERLYAHLKRSH